jgi:hypothetical protein
VYPAMGSGLLREKAVAPLRDGDPRASVPAGQAESPAAGISPALVVRHRSFAGYVNRLVLVAPPCETINAGVSDY